ncbi:hypothetical protein E4U30_002066 [Claviceps sp. LM220 group G6]|nr:hypothetical protein E4U30_002066 [Claviceps sp. LM220 group G6]
MPDTHAQQLGTGASHLHTPQLDASQFDENAGMAQKRGGRIRHSAFNNYEQVQGGLMCKFCETVMKTKD